MHQLYGIVKKGSGDFSRKRWSDEQPLNRNGACHALKFELKTFGLKISLSYSPKS